MADKAKSERSFPFDNDAVPFPHRNAPSDQNLIDAPEDGQLAFEFVDGVYPPDPGVQIESPDLTDENTFGNLPKSYTEHVEALKKEGAIDVDAEYGSVLEQPDPDTFAIVNETTEEPKSTSAEAIQESELEAEADKKAAEEKVAEEKAAEEKAAEEKAAEEKPAPKRRTRAEVASE